jgi:nitrate/TMAO reductase-like tetraheme cytochrome c subunit
MSEANTPRRRRGLVLLLALGFALFALGSLSFVVASALEEHDPFCISCHTAPEITYYNRAYYALDHPAEAIPDLSTLALSRCASCWLSAVQVH